MAGSLQLHEKSPKDVPGQIINRQLLDLFLALSRRERQEEAEGIPIAPLCVPREISFGNKMFQEEPPDPGTQ
jgi:hypothetical protein